MNQMKRYALVLLMLLGGCQFISKKANSDVLNGTWRLSDISSAGQGETESFDQQAAHNSQLKEGLVLAFFEDGTFSELGKQGQYRTGNWSYSKEDHKLLLGETSKTKAARTVH